MENDKAEIDQVTSAHSKKASFFRRLTPIIAVVAVLALVVCVQSWFIYKLKKDVSGLQWSNAIAQHADDSEITTDVGTIQFMKKGGYSITLSAAKYTADGLSLQGEIGNPTAMTITNLALKFTVTKPLYQYVDEYDKDPFWFFVIPPIGEAQAAPIAYIGPGKTSYFEVTIPNVKQTKDGIRMVVSFSETRLADFGNRMETKQQAQALARQQQEQALKQSQEQAKAQEPEEKHEHSRGFGIGR